MSAVAEPAAAARGRHARPTPSRARFERLHAIVRDRICLLEYAPGERLSEEELAAEFNVSRTPIRRVLSRLEAEGLVETRHGVGTIITDIKIEDLEQVYALRMELAVLIGRLDPLPRSAEDLDRVRRLLARCDALARRPGADQRMLARLNMEFYQELRAMTGNRPLREINDRLYHLTNRVWLASVPNINLRDEIEIFRREVADILAAMELGDLEAVGHIRRSHISMSFARLRRYGAAAAVRTWR
ncbi:MAG: GntR family transcriptional regulator [Rhodospirillaceae bacterium]|nr:GntR family transcriptional regulator [Rhodospirillaceae bacterium]